MAWFFFFFNKQSNYNEKYQSTMIQTNIIIQVIDKNIKSDLILWVNLANLAWSDLKKKIEVNSIFFDVLIHYLFNSAKI
jgi:hypothetical protein